VDFSYNMAQMIAVDADIVRKIIGSVGLILIYGLSLWRIFKSNRGDKFIEFSSMTVMVFVLTMAVIRIRYFPDWFLESLEVLLYVLTFLSIFFMFQQIYRALRGRKTRLKSDK
jgi:CDP-diglyceride synthetase